MLDSSLLIFIQIVSESFPISSSGHIIVGTCLGIYYHLIDSTTIRALVSSEYIIWLSHIPTMVIVAIFFRDTWLPLVRHCWRYYRVIVRLIMYAAIADSVTLLWYIFFKLYPISLPLYVGFTLTAVLLVALWWCQQHGTTIPTISHMLVLGFVQGIALLPGISRFGIVYAVSCLLGIRSLKSFGIAWMLQWPLMLGGALISICHIPSMPPVHAAWIGSATFLAYIGLYCMYQAARYHCMWIVSIYMLVPIIVAYHLHC